MDDKALCKTLTCIIIALLVLCLFYVKKCSDEKMTGGTDAYSAGASQRHQSEITGTDQRPYSIPSNQEIRDAGVMADPQRHIKEDFANLDRYTKQEEVLASYLYGGEGFTSPASLVEGDLRDIAREEQY